MGNGKSKSYDKGQGKGPKLCLEIIRALDVPKADVLSESDPFVKVWVATSKGKTRMDKLRTLNRLDAKDPTWHSYLNLNVSPEDTDVLHFQLYDHDRDSSHDLLAEHAVPVADLDLSGKEMKLEFTPKGKYKKHPAPKVYVRVLTKPPAKKRTLFLIRHGESKWNAAQEEKQLHKMMAFDHGLNELGVKQAQQLNAAWQASKDDKDPRVQQFLGLGGVFASPLTRATSTCLLALKGHPFLKEHGIKLLRTVREVKNVGGLDTVGKAVGVEIEQRVLSELTEVIGDEAKEVMVPIDPYDANTKWWTPANDRDNQKEVKRRFISFLNTMRFHDAEVLCVTGHSLYFRDLCKTFLDKSFEKKNSEFAKKLKTKKLDNGACLCVDVEWDDDEQPHITDAKLMFGSKLKE